MKRGVQGDKDVGRMGGSRHAQSRFYLSRHDLRSGGSEETSHEEGCEKEERACVKTEDGIPVIALVFIGVPGLKGGKGVKIDSSSKITSS